MSLRLVTFVFRRSRTARTLQLAQGSPEGFDFTLVGQLLALGQLDQLQHFLHLIQSVPERISDLHHFVNRLPDGGTRRRGSGRGALERFGSGFERRRGGGCGLGGRRRNGGNVGGRRS